MAAPDAEKKGNSLEEIEDAVNKQLASCSDSKYNISVKLTEKVAEPPAAGLEKVAEPATEQGPVKGGKRNRRKTRSKRSARKSHKSRRVFGGKRK